MKRQSFALEKRCVTIGGGTGGFVVNTGLSLLPVHPTAICTVFDSGGSSGILRDERGSLPQGDIRRCLLALSDGQQDILRALFDHRFRSTGSSFLDDHSFGNLMLEAAVEIWGPIEGVRRLGRLYNLKGDVFPVSIDKAHLCATLSDGKTLKGESKIDRRSLKDMRTIECVCLKPKAVACREVIEAIGKADVIILGPGDLYTSIIPNLLVEGVVDAINRSKAQVCYVANIMTKWSETRGYSVPTFVGKLREYGIEKLDAVLVNKAPVPRALLRKYRDEEKATPVSCTPRMAARLRREGIRVLRGDFLSKPGLGTDLIRHDSYTLARRIVELGPVV